MKLFFSDWLVVTLYFLISAAIGLAYTRKASRSLADYFVSGRALPWWLAGTSMVATTFAADTPLAVAGFVAKYGVAGNWLQERTEHSAPGRTAPAGTPGPSPPGSRIRLCR
jgi:solute:Na+ symporter, SSS family